MKTNRRKSSGGRVRGALLLSVAAVMLGATPIVGSASAALATPVDKTLCVFDPGGKNGDLFAKMQDYRIHAVTWGVNFTLKAYTDESVAASDFRNASCDAVVLTGLSGREFNPTTYTVEAMGLFDSYKALERVISMLTLPSAAELNRSGSGAVSFENAGIYPAGAVYLYLRDRQNASLPRLSGRSIALIGGDPAARAMIDRVGATAKRAEVSTFASMFKNGSVDACYAPATAHKPLELSRGIGKTGGVVRFPLAQLTFQVFIRPDQFPVEFGRRSREFVHSQFWPMITLVTKAEDAAGPWIEVSAADRQRYDDLLGSVRGALLESRVYDATVVKLARK